jgi:hypothetical protein
MAYIAYGLFALAACQKGCDSNWSILSCMAGLCFAGAALLNDLNAAGA